LAGDAEIAEVGVRPEDIRVSAWAQGQPGTPSRIYEVEPLGGYTVVTIDAGPSRVRALMRGQPDIRAEAMVALSCDAAAVHLFSRNGTALSR
jgi:multiple sugar transport system ATP-binding protein